MESLLGSQCRQQRRPFGDEVGASGWAPDGSPGTLEVEAVVEEEELLMEGRVVGVVVRLLVLEVEVNGQRAYRCLWPRSSAWRGPRRPASGILLGRAPCRKTTSY